MTYGGLVEDPRTVMVCNFNEAFEFGQEGG